MATGEAIARQVGILEGDEADGRHPWVLTGPELRQMSDDALNTVIEETNVRKVVKFLLATLID